MIELKDVAQAIGEPFQADSIFQKKRLASIRDLVEGNDIGIAAIQAAEETYSARVHAAFEALSAAAVTPPSVNSKIVEAAQEHHAVRVKSETGTRYSFGVKWNQSVVAGKGIAVSPANRDKLNNQYATYKVLEGADAEAAVAEAAGMEAVAVAKYIASQFSPADIGN